MVWFLLELSIYTLLYHTFLVFRQFTLTPRTFSCYNKSMTKYKPIPCLPGYEVSEVGTVRDATGKVLPKSIVGRGTEVVTVGGDKFVVTRLTSEAWSTAVKQSARFRQPSR